MSEYIELISANGDRDTQLLADYLNRTIHIAASRSVYTGQV